MVECCIANSFDCPHLTPSQFFLFTREDQRLRTGSLAPDMNMSLSPLLVSRQEEVKRMTSWFLISPVYTSHVLSYI